MNKTILTTFAAALTAISTMGQSYDILGIKKVNPGSMQAITENQEVKGYYSLMAADKAGKKQRNYVLSILDNNLKRTYVVDLVKSDRLVMLESSYNGERFCFSYYDARQRILEYDVLDKTGKAVGQYSLEISKVEGQLYSQMLATDDDTYQGTLVAVKGKGFIRYGYEKENGFRISMEMIDNSGNRKWEADSRVTTKKSYESVYPLFTDDRVAIAVLTTRDKLFGTQNTEYSVIFLNTDNGKEYFRLKSAGPEGYQLCALGASFNSQSQTYFVYGQFFGKDDDLTKDDSKGFYMQEVDLDGKVISDGFTKWEEQINGTLARKSKGEIKKNMKLFVHTVVRTTDGRVFAIGEQYRKAASGIGIASQVLNGGNSGTSVVKVETHNMVCLEFDEKLKFKDATIYNKNKTNIQLPQGWGTVDANRLGSLLNTYGYFDYAFTSTSADKKCFTSCYVDYDKDKEAGSNYTIGNIGLNKDQALMYDKIQLVTKPSTFYVYKAKPGYIAIFEYYKKDKKGTLRLEKLNF